MPGSDPYARSAASPRFLAEASEMLSESLDDNLTLSRVTRLVVPDLADWCTVDRFEGIRELVAMALSSEGHQVVTAQNGAAALKAIAQSPPDVILLDMKMPVMDGWELARRYREMPGPHAPIIVITAAQDAASRAAEVAADGHLPKQFNLEDLFRVVEEHSPSN